MLLESTFEETSATEGDHPEEGLISHFWLKAF